MHSKDQAYIQMLEDRKKAIQDNLTRLRGITGDTSTRHSIQIKGYEIELTELQRAIDDYTSRRTLSDRVERSIERIEERYERNSERARNYQEEIRELQELKERLLTNRAKHRVDRRIERIQNRLKTMENRMKRCTNRQRRMMIPRYRRDLQRTRILSRQQGRINAYEERIRDNEELKTMLNRDRLIDNIRERIYDIRGHFYQRSLERAQGVMEEMQSTDCITRMRGARITYMRRELVDRLRRAGVLRPEEEPVAAPVLS